MKFYGVKQALVAWREIVVEIMNKECCEVQYDGLDRHYFEVELNKEELEFLQKNYWYEIQVGQELPWNQRVAFEK